MNKDEQLAKKTSWKEFLHFVFHAKLSWVLIVIAACSTILAQEITVRLPGSTAKLLAGDFSKEAVVQLLIYYGLEILVTVVLNLCSVYANSRSVKGIRTSVWHKMMHIDSSFYAKKDGNYMMSAITNDSTVVVTSLIMALQMIPASIYLLIRAYTQIAEFSVKLVLLLVSLFPLYIVYGIFAGKYQAKINNKVQ